MVDEITKQTARPKLFSAGDCETGPGALITACAGGRKAAHSIDRFINGLPLEPEERIISIASLIGSSCMTAKKTSEYRAAGSANSSRCCPPETRKYTFDEVEQGFPESGCHRRSRPLSALLPGGHRWRSVTRTAAA